MRARGLARGTLGMLLTTTAVLAGVLVWYSRQPAAFAYFQGGASTTKTRMITPPLPGLPLKWPLGGTCDGRAPIVDAQDALWQAAVSVPGAVDLPFFEVLHF